MGMLSKEELLDSMTDYVKEFYGPEINEHRRIMYEHSANSAIITFDEAAKDYAAYCMNKPEMVEELEGYLSC